MYIITSLFNYVLLIQCFCFVFCLELGSASVDDLFPDFSAIHKKKGEQLVFFCFVQNKLFRRHSANKKKKRRTGDDVKNRFSAIDKKKRRKYGASEMSFPATFGGLKYNRRYDRWTVICNI